MRLNEPWLLIVLVAVLSAAIVSLLRFTVKWILHRTHSETRSRVLNKALRPAQLMAATGGVQILLFVKRHQDGWGYSFKSGDADGWNPDLSTILMFATVISGAWLASNLLSLIKDPVEGRWGSLAQHDVDGRKRRTQIAVMYRLLAAAIWLIAAGIILFNVPALRVVGTSVLAGAGVAGVVAALAAQTMLSNMFAGLSLAFGDALRLEDVVVVEGEWGRIEEITLSYVVIRIWDERRLVLPSKYFSQTPYVNWTRNAPQVIGTVRMDADWRLPVDEARIELRRFLEDHPQWDGRKCGIIVLSSVGPYMQLRLLVSAGSPSDQWDLRCAIREHMISWIVSEHPTCIPRMHVNTYDSGADAWMDEPPVISIPHMRDSARERQIDAGATDDFRT
ncbi:mechanosensitive ion channel family protein [Salininema proteolyticum]|uniref:Mechanosensitive ion channel family protein n=1 Tax=Salininema proteolyticum TaxID=1607685 RepID=A0ABV8TTB8_9ACTN